MPLRITPTLFRSSGAFFVPPVTESEVLTASEGMRDMMDYYAHATSTTAILERLAALGHLRSPVNTGALIVVRVGDHALAYRGRAIQQQMPLSSMS